MVGPVYSRSPELATMRMAALRLSSSLSSNKVEMVMRMVRGMWVVIEVKMLRVAGLSVVREMRLVSEVRVVRRQEWGV